MNILKLIAFVLLALLKACLAVVKFLALMVFGFAVKADKAAERQLKGTATNKA